VSGESQNGYVLFVWTTAGWVLRDHDGEPPSVGEQIEEDGARLLVSKVGPSPLPGDRRRCVYTTSA
jgi:hypothetical protein